MSVAMWTSSDSLGCWFLPFHLEFLMLSHRSHVFCLFIMFDYCNSSTLFAGPNVLSSFDLFYWWGFPLDFLFDMLFMCFSHFHECVSVVYMPMYMHVCIVCKWACTCVSIHVDWEEKEKHESRQTKTILPSEDWSQDNPKPRPAYALWESQSWKERKGKWERQTDIKSLYTEIHIQ